jgi:hypothetical protein
LVQSEHENFYQEKFKGGQDGTQHKEFDQIFDLRLLVAVEVDDSHDYW